MYSALLVYLNNERNAIYNLLNEGKYVNSRMLNFLIHHSRRDRKNYVTERCFFYPEKVKSKQNLYSA